MCGFSSVRFLEKISNVLGSLRHHLSQTERCIMHSFGNAIFSTMHLPITMKFYFCKFFIGGYILSMSLVCAIYRNIIEYFGCFAVRKQRVTF